MLFPREGKETAIVALQYEIFRVHTSSVWMTCSLQMSPVPPEPKGNSV